MLNIGLIVNPKCYIMNLKTIIVQFVLIFTALSSDGQTLSGCFSADNCYAVYLGDENSVNRIVLPTSGNIKVNTLAHQIFNATCFSAPYNPGEWCYIVAYSDDAQCQGLIGEFSDALQLKTGDSGWSVFGTGIDKDPNSPAPNMSDINSQISVANSSGGWVIPHVGESNMNTSKLCRAYSGVVKVNGISDDAKWIWMNSGDHNHANSPFQGYDHDEYLIFKFPVSSLTNSTSCCPEINKKLDEIKSDLKKLLKLRPNGGIGRG